MAVTVLICDDALFMRNVLKKMFAKLDYEVCGEAENPRDAVDKYTKLKPDLVTMDVIMPKAEGLHDGVAAAKEILKMNPEAKVIMMSSMGQESIVKEALEAGVKDFLVKPFQEPKLIETVNKVMGM